MEKKMAIFFSDDVKNVNREQWVNILLDGPGHNEPASQS